MTNEANKILPLPTSHDDEAICVARDDVRAMLVAEDVDAWPSGRGVELDGEIRGSRMKLTYSARGRWTAVLGAGEYHWPVTTTDDVIDLHDILSRSA